MINNKTIEIFETLDENKIIETLKELENLDDITEDGWNLAQLSAYYGLNSVYDYLSLNMSNENLNKETNPLLVALEEGNGDFILRILNSDTLKHVDLRAKEKSGENLLHMAIYYEMFDVAKKLNELGVSAFERNNRGETAIVEAIKKNKTELFDILNDNNNIVDNYDDSQIIASIKSDSGDIFERVLPLTNLTADEIFSLTAGFGSIKCMNLLMKSGEIIPGSEQLNSIVNLITKKYSDTSSALAAEELTDYLFDIKVPFSRFVNENGQSAWVLCINNDNETVFNRLMNTDESVNISDREQHTPLFYAIEKNKENIVKCLLRKKANPNHVDIVNNTPLIKAVELGNKNIVNELLKYGAQVNHKNNANESSLSIAIKKRRMDIVSPLIWAGGEITTNPAKFIEEKSILQLGANGQTERFAYHEESQIDNFIALSKLGFDLEQKNDEGDCFIHHFIKNGYLANFNAMLKCQINPNVVDSIGNTPLMCAAAKNQDVYFDRLVARYSNLDLTVINDNGHDVYDICIVGNKAKFLETLILIDQNIDCERLSIPLKLIAKDGDLAAIKSKVNFSKDIDIDYIDENGNNLIMYSLAGGNIKNIRFLIEECGATIDLERRNKFGHSLNSMISAIPTEEVNVEIKGCFKKNIKKP